MKSPSSRRALLIPYVPASVWTLVAAIDAFRLTAVVVGAAAVLATLQAAEVAAPDESPLLVASRTPLATLGTKTRRPVAATVQAAR